MSTSLSLLLKETTDKIETILDTLLPSIDSVERRLFEALRYACLGGGKRLRPFLVMESPKIFSVNPSCALNTAAAVEVIHSYSLIHDDLPCMDNGLLRRGKPTVHRQFDEATAILAGDALLTLAFEILANPKTHEDPYIRCLLISALAQAAGCRGMVAGQTLDLLAEKQKLDIGAMIRMHRLKSVELIVFACEAGAILGRASTPQRQALVSYAHDLGLAFQIIDDVIDATGTEAEAGKTVKQDASAGKASFVSVLGIERAKAQAELLTQQAIKHLDIFGNKADNLRVLARFMADRRA